MWGDGSSLSRGTKEAGVKRTKVFLLGRYLNPGRGTPVGWAAFPAGVGLTEQSLRRIEDLHSAQRHLYSCSPLCHSFNGNGIEEMKNYNGWHTGS
jgi:hypothetical protein